MCPPSVRLVSLCLPSCWSLCPHCLPSVSFCLRSCLVSLLSPFVSGLVPLVSLLSPFVSLLPFFTVSLVSLLSFLSTFLLVIVSALSPFCLPLSPVLSPFLLVLCPSCLPSVRSGVFGHVNLKNFFPSFWRMLFGFLLSLHHFSSPSAPAHQYRADHPSSWPLWPLLNSSTVAPSAHQERISPSVAQAAIAAPAHGICSILSRNNAVQCAPPPAPPSHALGADTLTFPDPMGCSHSCEMSDRRCSCSRRRCHHVFRLCLAILHMCLPTLDSSPPLACNPSHLSRSGLLCPAILHICLPAVGCVSLAIRYICLPALGCCVRLCLAILKFTFVSHL